MRIQTGAVVLALAVDWVASSSCVEDKLSAAYDAAMDLPLSPACVGQWQDWKIRQDASAFHAVSRNTRIFACAQSACRRDINTSATALKLIKCDEAQFSSARMTRLLRYCEGLTLPLSLPRCSAEQNQADLGTVVPTECGPVNAPTVDHVFNTSILFKGDGVCAAPCVAALQANVNAGLPECRTAFNGLPVSKKQLYLNDLVYRCGPAARSQPATYDPSSCNAKLAELYATPFSDACNAVLIGNDIYPPTKATNLVFFETLYGLYMVTSKVIASKPLCAADLAALEVRLGSIGPCAANVSFGFQVLKLAHTANPTAAAPSTLAVCTKSQDNLVAEALKGKAPAECTLNNPSVTLWSNVFYAPLPDIAPIAAAPGCVAAAVEFATKNFPNCELAYPDDGDAASGVPVATRMTRYLLAAQTLVAKAPGSAPTVKASSAAPTSPFQSSVEGVMVALLAAAVAVAV